MSIHSDGMVEVPQRLLKPTWIPAGQGLRPVDMPVCPPRRRQTRSTYEWVECNSSPPSGLEAAPYDGACVEYFDEDFDDDFDEAGLEPLESPVRPNTPVRVAESHEYREPPSVQVTAARQYRECIISPQGRPKGPPFRGGPQSPRRPHPTLGSPFDFVQRQVKQNLDEDAKSNWSSDYGSPKDAATIYLPLAINGKDDNMGGSSPYQDVPEHLPLSMAKNRQQFRHSYTSAAGLEDDGEDWSLPYLVTAPDRSPLSMVKRRQDFGQSHTSAAGLDVDAISDFELPNTPRFDSKLKCDLRSSPPYPDEDFPGYEEWEAWMESPSRGRACFRSPQKIAYSLVEDSPLPREKSRRSIRGRKSRLTNYGGVGGSRVFTAALEGLAADEADILEGAISMPLPESPAEEDALEVFSETPAEEFATGFAAHHDPIWWDDEL